MAAHPSMGLHFIIELLTKTWCRFHSEEQAYVVQHTSRRDWVCITQSTKWCYLWWWLHWWPAQNLACIQGLCDWIATWILRSIETLDLNMKCMWTDILSNWETAGHGTKSCNLNFNLLSAVDWCQVVTTYRQWGSGHIPLTKHTLVPHACYAEWNFSEETYSGLHVL